MTLLILSAVLFFGIHVVATIPSLRTQLTTGLGEQKYMAVFSVISGIGLIGMIAGYAIAPTSPVYEADPVEALSVGHMAMPIAFVLLAAANLGSYIRRVVVHPMNLGIAIWSSIHLWGNGDLASLILFGNFLWFSIWSTVAAVVRGKRWTGTPHWRNDAIAITVGIVLFGLFGWLHPTLFGPPIFGV